VRTRGYGAGRRALCRCVAERATALKARVLHERAWNCPTTGDRVCEGTCNVQNDSASVQNIAISPSSTDLENMWETEPDLSYPYAGYGTLVNSKFS